TGQGNGASPSRVPPGACGDCAVADKRPVLGSLVFICAGRTPWRPGWPGGAGARTSTQVGFRCPGVRNGVAWAGTWRRFRLCQFMASGIIYGRIPASAVHLCVDMQRMFAEETAWRTPWMPRVLPVVVRLCERRADRTCFTRFIPARSPGDGQGAWRRYWRRWESITLENLGEEGVELLPELQTFSPPARVLDKAHYSPWL